MDLSLTLTLVLPLCLCGGSLAGEESCMDYKLQFERVYSVPGHIAMLNSTLVSPDVFNHTAIPYNVSWYNPRTGRELSNETDRLLVKGETLWFLPTELEDAGEYVCIVRTPSKCYRQATKLIVEQPIPGECGRPRKADQTLTNQVNDDLSCPLGDYIKKLESYSVNYAIKWYKGCELIEHGEGRFTYRDTTKLKVEGVDPMDNGSYTCTLTFTLAGFTGTVSETINARVKKDYTLLPQVIEPFNEVIKAEWGSSFSKWCRVFVPCVGRSGVDIFWIARYQFISVVPSDHVYMEPQRSWRQESPERGVWLERLLKFSHLKDEDFHINYTCMAFSFRGTPQGHFTLLPADPNLLIPIGLVLGSLAFLFTVSVIFYHLFKIDIVLCFRRTFPILYTNTESDGKLYDAYVAYPRQFGVGEVEMFALHTLPQVLERAWGYKLFIADRDSLPGQAIVDSVEESMQASRRLLLLYNASTFSGNNRRSNSNISPCRGISDSCNNNSSGNSKSYSNHKSNNIDSSNSESYGSDSSSSNPTSHRSENSVTDHQSYSNDNNNNNNSLGSATDGSVPEAAGQQFEREMAMYRALLEGSLKVVLVEMEEVTLAQLALFPESVRHLRKKQGAVCWWKSQRTRRTGWGRTCLGQGEDEEKGGQDTTSSLSTSSRFWREIKYYMPVRGKRTAYPGKDYSPNLVMRCKRKATPQNTHLI